MDLDETGWAQVKDAFQTLLEMDAAGRAVYLASASVPEDLRRTLEELLRANEEAGSFLNLPPELSPAEAPMAVRSAAQGRLPDGFLLARRFRVRRFLAKGGMGEVYEADDLELKMRVAIKTIRPEIAAYAGVLERFRREVQLAMQVTHPHVCRVFDLLRDCDSSLGEIVFLSMEFLEGPTLGAVLREQGRMTTERAMEILLQVLSGLKAAHGAGVLHRDLKPENIVLEAGRDAAVRAVITDFGMAWSAKSSVDLTLTGSGQVLLGTPEYMSPEQIEGKELSAASDIYSLGLVMYQMVTGTQAFASETPLYSVLRRMTEAPLPPSRVEAEIDPRWDRIVSRCLDRDVKRRYGSVAELEAALVERMRPARAGEARWWRQVANARRWLFSGRGETFAIAGLVLCVTGIWATTWPLHGGVPAGHNLTLVLADVVNTTGDAMLDDTLNVAIGAKLQQSPFLSVMPDAKVREQLRFMGLADHARLTESVAREVCERGQGQVVVQASIAGTAQGYLLGMRAEQCQTGKVLADERIPVDRQASVLQALDQATDAIRPKLGESLESIRRYDVSLGEATTNSLEALAEFSAGGNWSSPGPAALAHYQRAIALDPNFALAYARLGTIYGNMGETERSEAALREAWDRRDRVTEWERFYIDSHYYGFVTGEIEKEKATYEQWASVYPHDMAWTMNLGVDYGFAGEFDKAVALQKRASEEEPGNAASYANLAQYYLAEDKPDEAGAVLDEARKLHIVDVSLQTDRYDLAFYRDDANGMQALMTNVAEDPSAEDALWSRQAATEDSQGHLAAGVEDAERAAEVARRGGNQESSANWLAAEAVRQAAMDAPASVSRLIAQVAAMPKAARGRDEQVMLAQALVESGEAARAAAIMTELERRYPLDTLIQSYWGPIVRAEMALDAGKAAEAVRLAQLAEPWDMGIFSPGQCMDAAYVRGRALLAQRQGAEAAVEFRRILDHRGVVLSCPNSALAQLGLSRALATSGDAAASRHAYQDLFALWKDAQPRLKPLQQARVEYAALH